MVSGVTGGLRELAERATPGPWRDAGTAGGVVTDNPETLAVERERRGDDHIEFYGGALVFESAEKPDRAFIAAANPQVVLALLDDSGVLARVVSELTEAWGGHLPYCPEDGPCEVRCADMRAALSRLAAVSGGPK